MLNLKWVTYSGKQSTLNLKRTSQFPQTIKLLKVITALLKMLALKPSSWTTMSQPFSTSKTSHANLTASSSTTTIKLNSLNLTPPFLILSIVTKWPSLIFGKYSKSRIVALAIFWLDKIWPHSIWQCKSKITTTSYEKQYHICRSEITDILSTLTFQKAAIKKTRTWLLSNQGKSRL